MRLIMVLMLSLNIQQAIADISVVHGFGNAQQIFSGTQPRDSATNRVDLDVSIETKSTIGGIQSVIGYDFLCDGDTQANQLQQKKSTQEKSLDLSFPTATPFLFDEWPVGQKNCFLNFSMHSVATKANTGETITFSIGGAFGGMTITINNQYDTPNYQDGYSGRSMFTMLKDPPLTSGGGGGSNCLISSPVKSLPNKG